VRRVSRAGLRIAAHAASDVGRVRQQNEDSLFVGSTVFAVADGMGGHQAGEIASDMALQPIAEVDGRHFPDVASAEQALVDAISDANQAVVEEATANPGRRGMGTTLTAVLVRDGRLHVAHVGDSRAYLLRESDGITQLTTDHTLVEQLVREGRLSRDEAATHPQRSVITRAIGVDREVQVDSLPSLEMQGGDQVLLCSDGLTGPVGDDDIARILLDTPDGDEACKRLVAAANAGGGPDNITVVLLRVDGERAPTRTADAHADTAALAPADAAERDAGAAANPGGGGAAAEPVSPPRSERPADAPASRPRRLRRLLAWAAGALALLALLAFGGWFLLQRTFFVGEADGAVAIYQGVPQDVAGVALNRVVEETTLDAGDLPPVRQRRLGSGITVESVAEGRSLVRSWQEDLAREAEAQAEGAESDAEAQPRADAAPGTEAPVSPDADPAP
jgi:PPM family protein phosphatase